jgi:hypothetical protein
MAMTRKQFLRSVGGGSALLLQQACGGGYDAPVECGSSGTSIAGNHGHAFVIPVADLVSTTDKTYTMTGTASHPHTVTLTPAQLRDIRDGRRVTVTSTSNSTPAHTHAVSVSCA